MRIILFLLINIFMVVNILAEIPDIKKLWKKYDYTTEQGKILDLKNRSKLDIASEYVVNGEYKKALKIYEQLLNKNINSSHLHTALAFCFEKMGETDNAILLLNKAITLTPVDPNAYNNLAYILAGKMLNPEELIGPLEIISKALKYDKNNISYLKTKLYILRKANLMEEWEKTALYILNINPNISEFNIELGKYYYDLKIYDKARLYLNRALPNEKALEILAMLPANIKGTIINNENINQIEKVNNYDSDEEKKNEQKDFYKNLKKFENDYLVNMSGDKGKKKEEIIKEKEINEEESGSVITDFNALKYRVNNYSDFDKGLKNYNEGYFEKALEYFNNFIDQSTKNKEFSEKLSRAYKYKGLINTKHGKNNKELWDVISFIDESVYIEKYLIFSRAGNKLEIKKILLDMLKTTAFTSLEPLINLRLSLIDEYKTDKESYEYYSKIDFYIPDKTLITFSAKALENFSSGYKSLIERKYSQAEKYMTMAVNNDPGYYIAYYNLAVLNIKKYEYVQAMEYLKQALKYCPFEDKSFEKIRRLYNRFSLYV